MSEPFLDCASFDGADDILRRALVWDNVWPWEPWCGNGLDRLGSFRSAGWDVLSLTVAGDNHDPCEAFLRLAGLRRELQARDDCVLIGAFADLRDARAAGKLAVTLHFEGTRCFGTNIETVAAFRSLGVTHNLLAFNNANAAAGGCMEAEDGGITEWGRCLVREMERVGMLVDLSHTGRRSSMQALDMAERPMLFTHSNADAVARHPRNVTDNQIRACADTGGIVGLSGSSGYLGDEQASTDAMLRHLEHIAKIAGEDHVALGLDIVFDHDALNAWIRGRPDEWPMARDPAWPGFRYAQLHQLRDLVRRLLQSGWAEASIEKFLGGNYLRVMRDVLA